jgi:NhaP-type Na+/H+ or K+/H+ antiporter
VDWPTVVAAGVAGFGLGVGFVVGAYVVRTLRRLERDFENPDDPGDPEP